MKKFLILPVLLLFTLAANAQLFTIFGQGCGFIYVGPKAGAAYSTISNYSDFMGVEVKSKLGYQFGAVGEFGFTSKFSIQSELLFYSRGVKYENIDDIPSNVKYDLEFMFFNYKKGIKRIPESVIKYFNIKDNQTSTFVDENGESYFFDN